METFRNLFDGIRTKLHLSAAAGILLLTACGLIFLIRPDAALTLICRLIGIVLLVCGARVIVRYVTEKGKKNKDTSLLFVLFSVILIIIGLVIARNPVSLVNIAAFLLSIILLLSGIFWFVILSGRSTEDRTFSWRLSRCGAAALIVMGILMLFSPFATSVFLLRLIGIAFLFAAASGFMQYMKTRKNIQTAGDDVSDTVHRFAGEFERMTGKNLHGKDIIDGTAVEVTDDDTPKS